ncbi:MAG: hypothetical protein O2818_08590 [Bacteroidetes bacterium]|nr:hypothetical protein [Bacteroidota bacterium]
MRFSAFSQSSFLSFLTGLLLLSSCSVQNHQFLAGFEVATATQQPADLVSQEFEPVESSFNQFAPLCIKSTKSVSSEAHESQVKAESPLELKAIPTIKNRSPKTPNDVASNAVTVEQLEIRTPKNTAETQQAAIADPKPDLEVLRRKAAFKGFMRLFLALLLGTLFIFLDPMLGLGVSIIIFMLLISALKWRSISRSSDRLIKWWEEKQERKNKKFVQKIPSYLKWLIAIPISVFMFLVFFLGQL